MMRKHCSLLCSLVQKRCRHGRTTVKMGANRKYDFIAGHDFKDRRDRDIYDRGIAWGILA